MTAPLTLKVMVWPARIVWSVARRKFACTFMVCPMAEEAGATTATDFAGLTVTLPVAFVGEWHASPANSAETEFVPAPTGESSFKGRDAIPLELVLALPRAAPLTLKARLS